MTQWLTDSDRPISPSIGVRRYSAQPSQPTWNSLWTSIYNIVKRTLSVYGLAPIFDWLGNKPSQQDRYEPNYDFTLATASTLRRIQGSLSDNWASAAHTPLTFHREQSSRWAQAEKKFSVTVSNRFLKTSSSRFKAPVGNAPSPYEEILGLDDIFPSQVTGLFTEESAFQSEGFVQSPALAVASAMPENVFEHHDSAQNYGESSEPTATPISACQISQAQASTQASAEEVSHSKHSIPPQSETPANERVTKPYPTIRTTEPDLSNSAQTNSLHQSHSQPGMDSVPPSQPPSRPPRWFEQTDEDTPVTQTAPVQPAPRMSPLPKETDLSPHQPKVEPSAAMPVDETKVTEKPEAKERWSVGSTPTTDTFVENACRILENFTQNVKKIRAENPKVETATEPVPTPEPIAPSASPDSTAKPSYRPKPLKLEHELGDDLDCCDYMVRNNQILSNSISNLVDTYFKHSNLDDEPNYY